MIIHDTVPLNSRTVTQLPSTGTVISKTQRILDCRPWVIFSFEQCCASGSLKDPYSFRKQIRICINVYSRIRIGSASKSTFRSCGGLKSSYGWQWRSSLTIEACRFNMEPWRVCRPVVANLHHFDEEQNSDPHQSEDLDPDKHQSENSKTDPDSQPS